VAGLWKVTTMIGLNKREWIFVFSRITIPFLLLRECDRGIIWNDPAIGIEWPKDGPPILSK